MKANRTFGQPQRIHTLSAEPPVKGSQKSLPKTPVPKMTVFGTLQRLQEGYALHRSKYPRQNRCSFGRFLKSALFENGFGLQLLLSVPRAFGCAWLLFGDGAVNVCYVSFGDEADT